MPTDTSSPATPRWPTPSPLDDVNPNIARTYDWAAGGDFNTAIDREFGEQVSLVLPVDLVVRRNLTFIAETLHHAFDNGVRQILDLGCGMPTGPACHHRTAGLPGLSAVFVDYDPVVTNACIATLEEHPDPSSAVLHADLRDPDAVLYSPQVRAILDLSQPVLVLAAAVLHHVPDEHSPGNVLARYRDRVAPGSYLALSHVTDPGEPGDRLRLSAARRLFRDAGHPLHPRIALVLNGWLAGLDPVPVGQHDPFLHFAAARIPAPQAAR
ncbi:SAM-dependent methyltransferase [Amycolatopsis sp. PS_44_ISF1]|uniref:SAM-dependent methyltransferase n=1 Tax=Amycolatopsis sp. PS_44_ISF1 TaxID=2974917 RepID=UPI0028DDA43D|nr:SAM-dependent methyltransferase [Amycolatopsis sp. PS_44_ISF1]MDT8915123.1 SAM-dependent methyltransferase [Amycolatopsis sp. PS_44_ISF1]